MRSDFSICLHLHKFETTNKYEYRFTMKEKRHNKIFSHVMNLNVQLLSLWCGGWDPSPLCAGRPVCLQSLKFCVLKSDSFRKRLQFMLHSVQLCDSWRSTLHLRHVMVIHTTDGTGLGNNVAPRWCRQCSTASWTEAKRRLFVTGFEKKPPSSNCSTTEAEEETVLSHRC